MPGGGKKGMHSPEGRAGIANAMRTRTISPETRAKMAAAKKGRTISPEQRAKISAALKAKGLTRSPEVRAKMSAAKKGRKFTDAHKAEMRRVWDETHAPELGMGTGKRTLYGGIWFRSTYEARFARVLDQMEVAWEFEPKRFDLGDGITYLPDFWVPPWHLWIEIKGYFRDDDRVRINRFRQQVTHRLLVVTRPILEAFEGALLE